MRVHRLDLLLVIYAFCIAASELLGAKTFPLVPSLGLNASVAIFVFPIIFTINDVVAEVHGRERARGLVFAGMAVVSLVLVFTLLATQLPPSDRFAKSEAAYDEVFGSSARIAAASLIAFATAGLLDVLVFVRLRDRMQHRALWLRNNLSNVIAQLVDTVVFLTLAFYDTSTSLDHNASFLVGLVVPYWLVKSAVSVAQTPLVYAGVAWLRSGDA